MRSVAHQIAVVGVIVMLLGVAVSPPGQQAIEETTGIETVGEADGAIATGTAIAIGVGGIVVGGVGCAIFCSGTNTEKVEAADAEQTMIDIYSSASAAHDQAEIALTAMNNHLEDSREVALMVGKNAGIEAYRNDSSEIQAEQAAKNAIEDYYARKEVRLIKAWNVSLTHWEYLSKTVANETGIYSSSQKYQGSTYADLIGNPRNNGYVGLSTHSSTLANGTSVPVRGAMIYGHFVNPTSTNATIESGTVEVPKTDITIPGFLIRASQVSDSYSNFEYMKFSEYSSAWSKVDTLQNETKTEIQTFVSTTYPKWEAGKINSSEMIDPYLGSRYYSPEENFQAWALSTYSAMGFDSPANLSNFGSMTVTSDGTTRSGILMSKATPTGGTFEVGSTYNATTLDGTQYLIGVQDSYEITDSFTIESMRNASGGNISTVTYRDISYQSSNLSQYQQLAQELSDLREAIESKKQDALNGGGGFLPGVPLTLPQLLILGGGALLVLSALSIVTRQ